MLYAALGRVANLHGGKISKRGDEWYLTLSTLNTDEKKEKVLSYDTTLPEGFTIGSLKPEHTETVISEWVYLKYRPKSEYEEIVKMVCKASEF